MMTKRLNQFCILFSVLITYISYGQNERIMGLWKINKVEVGEENMTPVAKWTKINDDGTYQSGNGWLQNSKGTWSYDKELNTYSSADPLDISDEFGGFAVSFESGFMIWQREEEGMPVKVILESIKELPLAPADYLEGMWKLSEISKNAEPISFDARQEDKEKLFIRWDRIFLGFSPEGKKSSGYWHINGHRPEITLLPHREDGQVESWKIEVNDTKLVMNGISDTNEGIQRTYIRQHSF